MPSSMESWVGGWCVEEGDDDDDDGDGDDGIEVDASTVRCIMSSHCVRNQGVS